MLLIFCFRYFFKLDKLKYILICSAAIVIIYSIIRIVVGGVTLAKMDLIPISNLTLLERLFNIPAIIAYYLKIFIFPQSLIIFQTWIVKSYTIKSFVMPLIFSILFFAIIYAIIYILIKNINEKDQYSNQPTKHNKPGIMQINHKSNVIFFTIWFLLGLFPILQLVPLDMTVADRWFYFPIVGLLGLIGVIMQLIWARYQYLRKIFLTVFIIIICLLSTRTYIRTFDWKDKITIYTHDLKFGPENPILMANLANSLYEKHRYKEALTYAKKSLSISPTLGGWQALGLIYMANKQYDNAVSSNLNAIAFYRSLPKDNLKLGPGMVASKDALLNVIYLNLAITYIQMHRPYEAIKIIKDEALKKFPNDPRLYYYLANAEYLINNRPQALDAIAKAYQLNPSNVYKDIYQRLKNNLPIN